MTAHRRVEPARRKATDIVDIAESVSAGYGHRLWRRTVSFACVLLLLAGALLIAAPQGGRLTPAAVAPAGSGTLAVDDGHVDLATLQFRQLAVESTDGKRGGPDGKGPPAMPAASARLAAPGAGLCALAPAASPDRADADRFCDRSPTGPPAA